jgi:hypothetical protein
VKVWITKYALTAGIYQEEVERTEHGVWKDDERGGGRGYYANAWHETADGAVARAEKMRAAKIASLEKQIAKLRNLDFAKMVRD